LQLHHASDFFFTYVLIHLKPKRKSCLLLVPLFLQDSLEVSVRDRHEVPRHDIKLVSDRRSLASLRRRALSRTLPCLFFCEKHAFFSVTAKKEDML
jgi:hypothetical protein